MSQICPMCYEDEVGEYGDSQDFCSEQCEQAWMADEEDEPPRVLDSYLADGTKVERPKHRAWQRRIERWNDALVGARCAVEDGLDCETIVSYCTTSRNRSEGRDALFTLEGAIRHAREAFGTLALVQAEFRDWLDSMPESERSGVELDLLRVDVSPPRLSISEAKRVFALLGTLSDRDMPQEVDCGFHEAQGKLHACEGVILPRGFRN